MSFARFDMNQFLPAAAIQPIVEAAQPQIYLDHNASTPLAPEAVAAMRPLFDQGFGNPSSGHWASSLAAETLSAARSQVAELLGCEADEVVFTSGGTEANNLALKGAWFDRRRRGEHVVISAIEHDAVKAPVKFLRRLGAKVSVVPVDRYGRVDPDDVASAIRPDTALISIMHANNETGTIQPIKEIADIANRAGIPFHTDAAQSAGKIDTKVAELGVDMMSLAAHKMYGPKGIGALFVRRGTRLEPHNHGAGHEAGRRAGTESALLAAGFGAACALAGHKSWAPIARLRDYFWDRLRIRLGERVVLNVHPEHRVPNTLHVAFPNRIGAEILARLEGVAAATGSACHAGCIDMSQVLIAMRVPVHIGSGAIRFSLGLSNTQDEIDRVVSRLADIV
jgi:cysteine desulfurase